MEKLESVAPNDQEPARTVLGEFKVEAGLGGTNNGIFKDRELWWLM